MNTLTKIIIASSAAFVLGAGLFFMAGWFSRVNDEEARRLDLMQDYLKVFNLTLVIIIL